MPFLSLVILTFDLQTRPSEGPNTSCVWIWHFGAKPFSGSPRYISYTNKNTQTDGAKNRTFRSSLLAGTMQWILTVLNLVKSSYELECGPMPNVMAALPNIGGALCSTPRSLADGHY